MIINDYYDVSINLFDKQTEVTPTQVTFSIRDSIKSFYSTAEIQIEDYTGLLKEYPINIEGFKYKIQYGTRDDEQNVLNNDFVVHHDQGNDQSGKILNNTIKMTLIHDYFSLKNVNNQAYKGRISEVVKKIISEYPFASTVFNDTSNYGIWYRLFLDQRDFIEQVLVPNAYSENAFKTSFYPFIGFNNTFNFRNYYAMMTDTPIAELTLVPNTKETINKNSIISIVPFRKGSEYTHNLRKRILFSRDLKTGEFLKSEDTIKDFPSQGFTSNIPIIKQDFETSYEYLSWKYASGEPLESFNARSYLSERDGYGLEKFLITTPLNTILKSGKNITLNLSVLNEKNAATPSIYYNGSYLIEECVHSWYGKVRAGQTQILVSRKYVKPSPSYDLINKLL